MMEVRFYHIVRSAPMNVIRLLCERSLKESWHVGVFSQKQEDIIRLDEALWVQDADSFIPHGVAGQCEAGRQPVLLSYGEPFQLPNKPQTWLLWGGLPVPLDQALDLKRICLIFEDMDDEAKSFARHEWSRCKEAGVLAEYWSDKEGRWAKLR